MWIPREIETLLSTTARQRPVVVVTGARQTGKTSLAQHLFPNCELVSLDLPSEAEQAERDPRGFLARHPPPLVVDEVQYAPGLFRHLKRAVDANRDRAGQFILTGSQKLTLMRAVSDSLAGRAAVLELEGLSFCEIHAACPHFEVDDVLLRGGFPELYKAPELNIEGFYRSYVATYLERDLRQLLRVSSLRDFERFVRASALRSAGLLNLAELARDVGISGSTARQWLSMLEISSQITLLEPWFSNQTKSLVKTPKLYINDSGLLAFLVGMRRASDLHGSPLRGALWETLVLAELRRAGINRKGGWQLNFWRDRSSEVDFLLHRGGRFDLADAKWTEHPDRGDVASLSRVAEKLPRDGAGRRAIFCRAGHRFPIDSRTEALPLSLVADWAEPDGR
ncbi:MAG: ATP-binding protein [Deltaproteobacteria bacterium]|nr:ATP-binding protein [Deltaproteobacteria bacterium]